MHGGIGSVLGLVGPVSVYCDWVRRDRKFDLKFQSVWQHVKLNRSVPEIHKHVAGTLSNQQTIHLRSCLENALAVYSELAKFAKASVFLGFTYLLEK